MKLGGLVLSMCTCIWMVVTSSAACCIPALMACRDCNSSPSLSSLWCFTLLLGGEPSLDMMLMLKMRKRGIYKREREGRERIMNGDARRLLELRSCEMIICCMNNLT